MNSNIQVDTAAVHWCAIRVKGVGDRGDGGRTNDALACAQIVQHSRKANTAVKLHVFEATLPRHGSSRPTVRLALSMIGKNDPWHAKESVKASRFDFSHGGNASLRAFWRSATWDSAMNAITSPSISAAAFAMLMAGMAQPAFGADPSNGERLAQRWCASCHVVTSTQREANADAPPFEEIAKRPNFNENGLMTFLLDPHAKMPNMNLSRNEAGDIAAYVATLR